MNLRVVFIKIHARYCESIGIIEGLKRRVLVTWESFR